jgi:hypothetical protein
MYVFYASHNVDDTKNAVPRAQELQFLKSCRRRPIFNIPQPPGVKFAPRGDFGPQGWTLFPRGNVHPFVHPQSKHYLKFRRIKEQKEDPHP